MDSTKTEGNTAVGSHHPLLVGPKRQHFLPRFYLNGFSKNGFLSVYDRESNSVRLQKPENTAVIGHFYTMADEQGRKRFELEQALSDIEANASPAIKKLAARCGLTADERTHLAIFLAMAMVRTPSHIDAIKAFGAELAQHVVQLSFLDVERAKASLRAVAGEPVSDEELHSKAERMVEFVKSEQYRITTNHHFAVSVAVPAFADIAAILEGRTWLVIHSTNEKKSFVTADMPLVLTTTSPNADDFSGVGFANANAFVMFPLTQSCALLIFGSDEGIRHSDVSPAQVRNFNLAVAERCQRFVIARDEVLVWSLVKHVGLANKKWQPNMRIMHSQ